MSRTRRLFLWSRCPTPKCEGQLGINGDMEIEEGCDLCGTEEYTDAEYDAIWANAEPVEEDTPDDDR